MFSKDVNVTKDIEVIPSHVNDSTITVIGHWNKFTISWDSVTNVNYGAVYYEIIVDDQIAAKTQVNIVIMFPH